MAHSETFICIPDESMVFFLFFLEQILPIRMLKLGSCTAKTPSRVRIPGYPWSVLFRCRKEKSLVHVLRRNRHLMQTWQRWCNHSNCLMNVTKETLRTWCQSRHKVRDSIRNQRFSQFVYFLRVTSNLVFNYNWKPRLYYYYPQIVIIQTQYI